MNIDDLTRTTASPSAEGGFRDRLPTQTAPRPTYPEALAVRRPRAWRGALALVSFVVGFVVLSVVFSTIGVLVDQAMGRPLQPNVMTPVTFASTLVALALLTPLSMLLQKVFFGVPMRTMFSVVGRFRWRLLGRAAVVVVPVWVAYVVGFTLLFPQPGCGAMPLSDMWFMLGVSVLLVPLQSAGEEFGFRGLVNRATASWGRGPRSAVLIGWIISSGLFCLAHGAGDPWLIAYYFAFGGSLAVVAWRTGGLEIGVLIHAVNNCLLFVVGTLSRTPLNFDRSNGTGGVFMLAPILLIIGCAVVAWLRTRRTGPIR